MRSLIRLITAMTKTERIVLAVLASVLLLSFAMILRTFYIANTTTVPVQGGTYIEGSVGEVLPLNPWFTTGNDVNRDIVGLVFAGLMKYDPASGGIVDDLATVQKSSDNRIYTATLRKDLFWHDSTDEHPHPVTADDVVFTFGATQEQGFGNPILQQNFRGVEIQKIDGRTVRFTLKKPYAFFTSNLTLGLLPKRAFEGIPPSKLKETLDFGFHPIGAGPYSFVSLLQTEMSTEVTLKRFPRRGMPPYNIEQVILRVFPDYGSLLTDVVNMNGVRIVARNEEGLPILPKNFQVTPFTLPQYVGLFFNLDRPVLADRKVRLGLQLGTNKQEIVDAINETHILDTPLLEFDLGDWRYAFDAEAAQGAFFESNWNVPEKIRLQRLLEQRETNAVGPLRSVQRIAFLGTGATLMLTGSTVGLTFPAFVNGARVQTGSIHGSKPLSLPGAWAVELHAGTGMSGSLKIGPNFLSMTNAKGDTIDSAFMERFADRKTFALAVQEQKLVDAFIRSKKLAAGDPERITVQDLYLESGFLRRKREGDEPHTRRNDKGKELTFTILTSSVPPTYATVAHLLQKQWKALGANVLLDIPETKKEFEEKLTKRQYDAVLFGQSLFDNLDSYPYWHSSQIQERDDPKKVRLDALNLSQYASFEADALLARIRETSDAASRAKALAGLREILRRDTPAIALYAPLYVFGHSQNIHGVSLGTLSLHADRFASFDRWYVATQRQFLPGRGWLQFIPWALGNR